MNVFVITEDHKVAVFSSEQEAPPEGARFRSEKELATAAVGWPAARLVQIWNLLPGVKPVCRFTDRETGIRRLWQVVQTGAGSEPECSVGSKRPKAAGTSKRNKRARGTKTEKILALLRQPSGPTTKGLMRVTTGRTAIYRFPRIAARSHSSLATMMPTTSKIDT